ncbi:mesaconyl-CoA isomerase [Chromatiales bacterium (ex Bugula neritina AB1)]|nr:mesaconyl-CoA isomerase [Chromatiales bacterium (ex Bugula neritina AB1)]
MQKVLSGMRVIEGSAFVAAPSGGMTLAQLGADVIRFDPIGGGIDYRRWPVTENNDSIYWHSLNKGKRSIAVDFRNPEGREILTRLITAPGDDAGLFLTNFPARGWLADDNLRAHREDLIYLNLTGDRHGGSALDYTVNCKVGFPYLNRNTEADEPINNPLPAWDLLAGQHIALGLLAAERHRLRTGKGQFVRLALADVALATIGHLGYIGEIMVNSSPRGPLGNHVYGNYGRDFTCKDGQQVMIVGISPKQWQAIVSATGLEQEIENLASSMKLDFNREGDRYTGGKEISLLLEPWFAERDYTTVTALFESAGVCWGKFQTMEELVHSDVDCSTGNPLFEQVVQPGVGEYLVPQNPLGFTMAEREPVRPAPRLGQHTDEILSDILEMDSGEIGRYHDAGIVAGALEPV